MRYNIVCNISWNILNYFEITQQSSNKLKPSQNHVAAWAFVTFMADVFFAFAGWDWHLGSLLQTI